MKVNEKCLLDNVLYILVINVLLSGVSCMDEVTLDLLTPVVEYGEACGYQSCPDPHPHALNVHLVPATHGELGYNAKFIEHYSGQDITHMTSSINMKNTYDSVITSLWSNDKRKFTVTDLPYFFYWWKNRDGTVRRMVYQLLRQGRLFFVGGGWSQPDESVSSYHAIIDQFTYTLRKLNATFLDCGRPLVTWQSDNFGHSREFASLMAQMGFDGHFINPISFDDELVRMRTKSLEFVWRGSDDLGAVTDIFTHKLYDGYWSPPEFCFDILCPDPLLVTSSQTFSNIEERVHEFTKLMSDRQGPYYSTNHIMVVMGRRSGYSDAEKWFSNMDRLITGVNGRQRHVKEKLFLYYSTPACYLKAVQKKQPTLTTKQDDFYPMAYDINSVATGYFTSRPIIKFMAKEMHLLLQITKQLQLFGRLKNNNNARFEDLHWITGVIHDHSILTGSMKDFVREYYVDKVHQAKQSSMRIIRPAINFLRNAATDVYMCPFNESCCWPVSGDASFIVVYNPLSWPVTLPIRLPVKRKQYLLFDPNGQPVNHSIISIPDIVKSIPVRSQKSHAPSMDDEMVFIAEDVPPMGYRSYFLRKLSTRRRRSIIKKINNKNKKKKYLTRQSSSVKLDADELLDDIDYEYFEDATVKPMDIQFANVSKDEVNVVLENDPILTPPSRTSRPNATRTTLTVSTTSTKTDVENTTENFETSTSPLSSPPPSTFPFPFTFPSPPTLPSPPTSPSALESLTQIFSPSTPESPSLTEESFKASNVTTTIASVYKPDNDTESEELDEESPARRMEVSKYFSEESNDRFIENEYVRINLNQDHTKINSMVLSNGLMMYLNIQMMVYVNDDPKQMGTEKLSPGVYVFRPMDPKPETVSEKPSLKVLKTDLVEEFHLKFASYAGVALKIYKGLPYVELDWVVGPLPINDKLGRDIFIRYSTDLENNGVFYTDANGRQTIKRVKDSRPTYTPVTKDGVGSNIYPVSSKVYIEDTNKNIRFSVFPDRGEGCTSLEQGTLDLMLHRRILTDDSGINLELNETIFGEGLIIRGKHMLYLARAGYRPNKVFEKKFAKELELKPTIFTAPYSNYEKWRQNNNEFSALKKKLPVGVHILTFEKWWENMLIRIENYLETTDVVRNGLKKVFIDELFRDYKLYKCEETMLAAHLWKKDYIQMLWSKGQFVKRFNDAYGNLSNAEPIEDMFQDYEPVVLTEGISLAPQQIRTFVCQYEDLTLV